MKMLDLFSGIGGFSLAGKWAGIETVAFCENDLFCRKILKKHWPNVIKYMDIQNVENPGHVDLITGGFPCQPFSVAGNKKGKNDARYLWPEFLRIITLSKPSWIVAENVTGIVGMELENILDDLEKEGYESQTFIIPACGANAPHRRDRVWIIANAMRKRCDDGIYYWETRYIQKNKKWDLASLQSEWQKLIPESWKIMSAYEFLQANAGFMRINDGLPHRVDRIKSLGNAIVPQVVYPILKLIREIEDLIK